MKVLKATRLPNPHRVAPRKKANARTRRKMTPKQIKHFGTKRQKAALKVKRSKHRPRTKSNPLAVTLRPVPVASASNPHHKRRNTVATKRAVKNRRRRVVAASRRRRPNPHHRRRRARNARPVAVARRRPNRRMRHRRNPAGTRIVVMAPRRNRRNGMRRNPNLFGNSLGSKATLKILGGGLAGVAAAKFIPQILPTSVTTSGLGSSTIGKVLITGVSAFAAYWIASKADAAFGEGVLFGGLMQTASVALNAFLPGFNIAGVPIALSGLADLVQGQFAVPQNPLRQMGGGMRQQMLPAGGNSAMPAPAGAKVTASGLGRAYPSAY
jgi:hypothetical protein